ncbi:MAG: hypothetical protein V2A74_10885 [bacterium]
MRTFYWLSHPIAETREESLLEFLRPRLDELGRAQFLLLVPSTRLRRRREERLQSIRQGGVWGGAAQTLGEWVESQARRCLPPFVKFDRLEQEFLVRRLLAENEQRWPTLRGVVRFAGLVRQLCDLLNRLRLDGEEGFKHLGSAAGGERRIADLRGLVDVYERRLRGPDRLLLDRAGLLHSLCESLRESPHLVRQTPLLVLDDFHHLSAVESNLLLLAAKAAEEVAMSVDGPHGLTPTRCAELTPSKTRPLFHTIIPLISRLAQDAAHAKQIASAPPRAESPATRAALDLFDLEPDPQNLFANVEREGRLRLWECSSPWGEVRAIARFVQEEHQRNPLRSLEEYFVFFPRMDAYAPLVRELFPLYGIPFRISRGWSLGAAPLAQVALRLLTLANDDFPREGVFEILSSAFVSYRPQISHRAAKDFFARLGLSESETKLALDEERPP